MIRILLTNDDGIHSDGLIKVEEALKSLGDVYVVAPAAEMSGASHSLTLARPLRIRQLDNRHWTVDGTPTDCVTLALNKILTDEEAAHFCTVDTHNRMAFVATRFEGDEEIIVGVIRYEKLGATGLQSAEMAILIDDAYQHRGLGSILNDD